MDEQHNQMEMVQLTLAVIPYPTAKIKCFSSVVPTEQISHPAMCVPWLELECRPTAWLCHRPGVSELFELCTPRASSGEAK